MNKKIWLTFITILFVIMSLKSHAQTIHPPGVEWQRGYSPNVDPFFSGGPLLIPEEHTGEDWWYDHKNAYTNGIHDGYICVGYCSIVNEEIVEPSGCIPERISTHPNDCRLDYPYIPNIYNTNTSSSLTNPIFGSTKLTYISRTDLNGNVLWTKMFDHGEFFRVIQSSDGGFVAVGNTRSSVDIFKNSVPLIYNPTISNPAGQVTPCDLACSYLGVPMDGPKKQVYVVKIDGSGKLIWKYRYGYYSTSDDKFCGTANDGYDIVELGTPPNLYYRVVGSSTTREKNQLPGVERNFFNTNGYILDIDYHGNKINDVVITSPGLIPPGQFAANTFNAIEKSVNSSGQEIVAITGNYGLVNRVLSPFWDIDAALVYYPGGSVSMGNVTGYSFNLLGYNTFGGNPSTSFDLVFDANNNLLIPVLFNGVGRVYDGEVLRYDPILSNPINHYGLNGPFCAFDMKMGITNTSDGGFAIVSSKVLNDYKATYYPGVNTGWICPNDNYDIQEWWNSDAYVAKYDPNGVFEWEKTVDEAPDELPANYLTGFPEDYKKQECMYSITQAADGGYVIDGNYSENLDDAYLVKLYSDCDGRILGDLINSQPNPSFYNANTSGPFTTQAWSTPKTVFGKLVIPAGQTLKIQNTSVNFFDSKSLDDETDIIVEPGGELLIENSNLDVVNSCGGKMWDGIQVLGNPSLPQNVANQGKVTVDNTVIRNARIAIMASSASRTHYNLINPDNTAGGGIVFVQGNSTFLNNRRSLFFGVYPNPISANSNPSNLSRILNSTFRSNDYMQDPNYHIFNNSVSQRVSSSQVVSAYACNAIRIDNCNFEVSGVAATLPYNFRPDAVSSIDVSFRISRCSFDGYLSGVNSHFTNNTIYDRLSIDNSRFTKTAYNVYALNGAFHRVANTTFNIPDAIGVPTGGKQYFGTWFDHADAGYIGFNNYLGSSANTAKKIGEVVTNSNLGGGLVEHNVFQNLEIGSQTELNNPNLLISCNNYTNHRYSWLVNPQNFGKLANQGTGSLPFEKRAGNNFYDPICIPNGSNIKHIFSQQGVEFAYWTSGDGNGTQTWYHDPTCINLPLRDGDPQDVIFSAISNPSDETSCNIINPCPNPPNCNERIAQINSIEDPIQRLNYANQLVSYFLDNNDTTGHLRALDYLSNIALTDSFANVALQNVNLRSNNLLNAIALNSPENQVYIDENSSFTTRRKTSKFVAYPNLIENINDNLKVANSNQSQLEKQTKLVVIPNPNTGNFELKFLQTEETSKQYTITIIDALGKLVFTKQVYDSSPINIDLSNELSGIYHILATSNTEIILNTRVSIVQ